MHAPVPPRGLSFSASRDKQDKPKIVHRWDGEHGGWFAARMKSLVASGEHEGKWNVRYYATRGHAAYGDYHTLKLEDNGVDKLWVLLA